MFKKLGIAVATAVGLSVMATGAMAATVHTYEWFGTGTPGNGGGQNVGNSTIFTSDNGLNVTTSFFSGANTTTGTGGSTADGHWAHGLGVIGSGSDSLDAESGEAIVFDFGFNVIAISALVIESPNAFGSADVSVWVDGVRIINGQNIGSSATTISLQNISGSQIVFMNVDSQGGCCNPNNRLRVKGLVVEGDRPQKDVPEPAALALIGFGLMGMGVVARRRKVA